MIEGLRPFFLSFLSFLSHKGMGELGIASSMPSGGDLEMGDPTSAMHVSSKGLDGNIHSREGEPSTNGRIRVQKINGCL